MAYYTEVVSDGFNTAMDDTPEAIELFINSEAPCCSKALGDITGLRVLDLACGSGRFTRWLKASKHAGEVLGVDMSEHMIEQVNTNYENYGI